MKPKTLTITVPKSESTSQVWVGRDILPTLASLLHTSHYSKVLVVGDRGASAISEQVTNALGIDRSQALLLQGGEDCKSLRCLEELWDFFAMSKMDRRGLIIGVGGGALSDLVGFAAATYMRGVAFAAVPTTLLAQVDASIGGKSGINVRGVKNLVGAIAQPVGIIIDTEVLNSLPEREIRSGFAEIVKHGLIADREYFDRVTSRECTQWQRDELVDIIFRSCEIKCSIVGQDAAEQGLRKALNFGHTIGHAVEAYALVESIPLTHGESVAIGMNAACHISRVVGLLSETHYQACVSGIARAGLPLSLPQNMDAQRLLDLLSLDKKNVGGIPRWTLLSDIGSVIVDQKVALDVVHQAISFIQPR
jgi:3-dehydroquinate synthase